MQRISRTPRTGVLWLTVAGAGIGWASLIACVIAMLPGADMATLGPGMGAFNAFNGFSDLPDELRKALAGLCAPAAIGPIGLVDAGGFFALWMAMVLAMMLPSAAPAISVSQGASANAWRTALWLAGGYLTAWLGFAALATVLQCALIEARVMRSAMVPMTDVLAGMTLVAVGIYQWTPWKAACLDRCRNPAPTFFTTEPTALVLYQRGIRLGLDCLGCCWALMAAMFAVGVMNLVWIAALTAVMVLEKLTSGAIVSRIVGLALIVMGASLILATPVGERVWALL